MTSAALPPGTLYCLSISNNVTAPQTAIDIAAGQCRDIADTHDIELSSTLTKRIDAKWAAGNGGGLDAGNKAANTWYFTHAIDVTAGGKADVIISTSPVTPALPTGFSPKRRIGSFKTDSSGNIIPMLQLPGRQFMYKRAGIRDINAAISTMPTLQTLPSVPLGIKVRVKLLVNVTGTAVTVISDPDLGVPADLSLAVGAGSEWDVVDVWTNTSQQIYLFAGTGTPTANIFVQGFCDYCDAAF
jgi:hypothetical protein